MNCTAAYFAPTGASRSSPAAKITAATKVASVFKNTSLNAPETIAAADADSFATFFLSSQTTFAKYSANTAEKANAKPLELGHKVLIEAAKLAPEDTIVVTDVGQHQMWTAQYYPVEKPRTFCSSGGLGTMGYALGASIGAAMASGKHVIMVTGDGCFNMNLNELSTAVTHDLPITILLMNNHALGMVRQWQKLFYGNRFSQTDVRKRTDYVRFAESFGAMGLAIEKDEDIVPVLTKALATQTPVLVDCRISNDENVLPMIKPGQTYDTIITDWEARE